MSTQDFSHIGIYRLPKVKIDNEIYILKVRSILRDQVSFVLTK